MSYAEDLGARITELCSQIYAAEYRLLALIREFDEHECWAELGLASCAHWLNFKCGIGMNAAREKLRVAHALAGLPKISERFARGELSYSKVRAMTRVANEGNEDYLLMIAEHGTAHHVEKLVAKCRQAKRLQATEGTDTAHRDLTHYYDHDGCLVIKARLPAEQGALVVKALEMAMDRDFRANDDAAEEGADVTAVTPEADDEHEPISARRADALAEIAETYLNNSESTGRTADRYQVVVHVDAGALVEQKQQPAPCSSQRSADGRLENSDEGSADVTAVTSHLEDGPHVTAETSRRICCDSSVVRLLKSEDGEPLSIGRRSRAIPPPMRRALQARDGGCRFPGCTHTRLVDGHHIKHWADGGETSIDNLILLCRHHHRLVHEGGFACEKANDGEVVFRDRTATRLPTHWALPGVATEDWQRWLDKEFFESGIAPDACVTRWQGERMDYQMAAEPLLS